MNIQTITQDCDLRIKALPTVVLQTESDEWGFLYRPETDFSFGISPMGILIWDQLQTGYTFNELSQMIKKACTNVPDNVDEIILQFLNKLLENGLVTLSND